MEEKREEKYGGSSEGTLAAEPEDDAMDWPGERSTVADAELEFGGPRGVVATIILMPVMVFSVNAACSKESCSVLAWPSWPSSGASYLDLDAVTIYLGWLCLQLLMHYSLPGRVCLGQPTPSGNRLLYTCNGFKCLVMSVVTFFTMMAMGYPVTLLYDKFFALMTTATITSFIISGFCYWKSHTAAILDFSTFGNTGFGAYDFYLGRELNPRLGCLDLKFFCELRPGLIGWLMLDLAFVVKYWEQYDHVSPTLVLVVAFHFVYVADALYYEEAVLTTLDITTEGFGFMLTFGDLTWVPFLFSLPARFLLEHPQSWSWITLLGILLLKVVGYWIFRSANNEKDLFRQDPTNRYFQGKTAVKTSTGKWLCASGWWGWSRHPNYCGDLMMALAWSLTCGFGHALPWFYMLYLTGTLLHRSGRDDKLCRQKYCSAWDTYCRMVPYKIIPGVY